MNQYATAAAFKQAVALHEVRAASSSISRRWGIVSRLGPEQFAEALKAARETD